MDDITPRTRMVEEQLAARGIHDRKVLDAFLRVPRHAFVPTAFREKAYEDSPLPIGSDQTISQPYMVALMTELLRPTGASKVLEIGTGSGYQTAILAEIVREVCSVERSPGLARSAEERLHELGYDRCHIRIGDGTLGWEEHAPYDGIIVTAGAPVVPERLTGQLKDGGRLIIPVGSRWQQVLTVIHKNGVSLEETEICGCVFVPLIGKEGWA